MCQPHESDEARCARDALTEMERDAALGSALRDGTLTVVGYTQAVAEGWADCDGSTD